jgi:hypothetical protein
MKFVKSAQPGRKNSPHSLGQKLNLTGVKPVSLPATRQILAELLVERRVAAAPCAADRDTLTGGQPVALTPTRAPTHTQIRA